MTRLAVMDVPNVLHKDGITMSLPQGDDCLFLLMSINLGLTACVQSNCNVHVYAIEYYLISKNISDLPTQLDVRTYFLHIVSVESDFFADNLNCMKTKDYF